MYYVSAYHFEYILTEQNILQMSILIEIKYTRPNLQNILDGFQNILDGFQNILDGFQNILDQFQNILDQFCRIY